MALPAKEVLNSIFNFRIFCERDERIQLYVLLRVQKSLKKIVQISSLRKTTKNRNPDISLTIQNGRSQH